MTRIIFIILVFVYSCSGQMLVRVIPSGTSSLNTGLVSFWNLDEESGTRYDAIGNNDLTDNNTVLYGSGKYSNAADFELSNSEYLNVIDDNSIAFDSTESFTVSCWINPETIGTTNYILGKSQGGGAPNIEYQTYVRSSNVIRFVTGNSAGATIAVTTATVSAGSWYCVTAWYNAATESLYVRLDNNTIARTAAANGPKDMNYNFLIGGVASSNVFDGLIDLVGIWSRCPTYTNGYAMADSIYNSGNGWKP